MEFLKYNDVSAEIKGAMVPGRLKMTDQNIIFKNSKTGKVEQISANEIELVNFQKFVGSWGLRVFLKNGTLHRYGGFRDGEQDKVAKFFKNNYHKDMLEKELSLKGWNWGTAKFNGAVLSFNVGSNTAFEIPLHYVSQCNTGKNEVTLEFHQNDDTPISLMEMRFHIPTNELAGDMDAVEAFHQQVMNKASVISVSGDAIAIFRELRCLTPRGRYDIKVFQTFFQLHGKTFDYRIPMSTVLRLFLLPHEDTRQMFFVVSLDPPIKQGQTRYHYLVLLFGIEEETSLELPFTKEELRDKYEGKISKELSGPTYEVLAKIMKVVINRRVTGPGDFLGHHKTPAIACSYKAAAGYLYPLEKGFIYVHKPPVHIRFEEIASVNFARVGTSSTKSFDFEIELKSGNVHTFSCIEKGEYDKLFDYITSKKLHVKNTGKNDKALYDDDFGDSDTEKEPDAYLARVIAEAKERDSSDSDGSDESTDEDFNSDKAKESDVAEEYDTNPSSSEESDASNASGDSKKEKKKEKKPKKTITISEAPRKRKEKSKKREKDANAPKRPATAFMLWLNESRKRIMDENPGIKVTDVAKKVGELWRRDVAYLSDKSDKALYDDDFGDSDTEKEPDAYLARVIAEAKERDSSDSDGSDESTDEDFNSDKAKESDVAEEYDTNPSSSEESDASNASGDSKKEKKKEKKPKKTITISEAPRKRKEKSKKREKDANAPKRPATAFMLWLNESRKRIMDENPGIKVTDVAKKVGELWRRDVAYLSDKSDKALYDDDFGDSDTEKEPDAYLARVIAEAKERDSSDSDGSDESTDEDFNSDKAKESDVAEEYDTNPSSSEESDASNASGDSKKENKKEKKPKKTITISEAPRKRKDKSKKREKDANAPKRPATAFMLWLNESRKRIMDENPGIKVTDVAKKVGELWRRDVAYLSDKSDKALYDDDFGDSDTEKEPDAYLARVKAEAKERDSGDSDGSDESTDEDFNPDKAKESDVAEEYDTNPSSSEESDASNASGDSKEEKKKEKKPKKTITISEAPRKRKEKSKKREKDANAPKRPATAFMLWLNESRKRIMDENPGIKVTDVAKKGGELWRDLSDKSSEAPRKRKEKSKKREKDANAPKHPATAFMLWLNESRKRIMDENPGIKVTDVAKKGGEMWRDLSDKSEWEEKPRKAKEEYNNAMKKYKESGAADEFKQKKKQADKERKAADKKSKPAPASKKAKNTSAGSGSASFKNKEYIEDDDSSSDSSSEKKEKSEKKKKKYYVPSMKNIYLHQTICIQNDNSKKEKAKHSSSEAASSGSGEDSGSDSD